MNIQRLKHAWARGARIQIWANGLGPWVDYERGQNRIFEAQFSLRVHPDDAHLEYGLLSTELRKRVIVGGSLSSLANTARATAFNLGNADSVDRPHWTKATPEYDLDCRFHALFLAEFLADEGL